MAKKFLAIIIAVLMVAALVACTPGTPEQTTDDPKINIDESTSGTESESEETDETGEQITDNNEKTPGELEYTESQGKVYILHENGAVNLRKADGTVFKSFNNGTEFQKIAVSEDGEWTKVVYEGADYYVVSSCLTDREDLDEGFEEISKTLVLKTSAISIRIAPSMNNRVVGYYNEGDEVKVIAENTEIGWYKVEFVAYGGATAYGYVASDAKYYVGEETTETGTEDTDTNTETGTEDTDTNTETGTEDTDTNTETGTEAAE